MIMGIRLSPMFREIFSPVMKYWRIAVHAGTVQRTIYGLDERKKGNTSSKARLQYLRLKEESTMLIEKRMLMSMNLKKTESEIRFLLNHFGLVTLITPE